jgi:hypothetical protein
VTLPLEQTHVRFDSIAISEQHWVRIQYSCTTIQYLSDSSGSWAKVVMNA